MDRVGPQWEVKLLHVHMNKRSLQKSSSQKPVICVEASTGRLGSSLFKSWSNEVRSDHYGGGGGLNFYKGIIL